MVTTACLVPLDQLGDEERDLFPLLLAVVSQSRSGHSRDCSSLSRSSSRDKLPRSFPLCCYYTLVLRQSPSSGAQPSPWPGSSRDAASPSSRSVSANEPRDRARGTAGIRWTSGGSSTSAACTQISRWMGSIPASSSRAPSCLLEKGSCQSRGGGKSISVVVGIIRITSLRIGYGVWDNFSADPWLLVCCGQQ